MSVLSANFTPASGLENATLGQKVDCSKEKIVAAAKNGAVAGGAGLLGGVAMTGVLQNDTFSKTLAKGFDKVITPNIKNSLKGAFETIVKMAKDNPTKTKALALIAVPLNIFASILTVKNIRDNAKIEGKHQERVDHANKN